MPFSKNEAEEVLRAAAGQSKPEVGDKIVWTEKGWTFIPNIFIGGGIDEYYALLLFDSNTNTFTDVMGKYNLSSKKGKLAGDVSINQWNHCFLG